DGAAGRFVRDDRYYLPVPGERPGILMFEIPGGDIWSVTGVATGQTRIGVFHRDGAGGYRLDEESPRPLLPFAPNRIMAWEKDAVLALCDDNVAVFDPHLGGAAPRPFAALIRSVRTSAGATV